MSAEPEDKCLVCLKAGPNLNIFNTYNVRNEKEEPYVEVIKNCFNIEICPESGLNAMCGECSIQLRKAYNFKHDILDGVNKLLSAQVITASEKPYSEIQYLEDIPFETDYDIDSVLNSETGQIYTLDEIYENKEINENNEHSYLLHLDNDAIVDKVLFNKSNENDKDNENIQKDDIGIDKVDPELNLEPVEISLLDKPVENFSINILSDVLVNEDLEPGEIRFIDKNVGIVDKRQIIIKGRDARNKNVVTTILSQGAGTVGNIPVNINNLGDEVLDTNKVSKTNTDKKYVNTNLRIQETSTLEMIDLKDLIVDKKKASKRKIVQKTKEDELSLLAQICTEKQNPEEYPTTNTKNEQETTNDQITNLMELDNDKYVSKEKSTKKGKKEPSVKVSKRKIVNIVEKNAKKDKLSLLAQICTGTQNIEEYPTTITTNETNKQETNLIENSDIEDNISKEKSPKKGKKNTEKKAPAKPSKRKTAKNAKKDDLTLLAQICTEKQNPEENPTTNEQETNLLDKDNDIVDNKQSKESKRPKRSRKKGKKEASVKENVSGNVEEVKPKRGRPKKTDRPPAKPFTLQPNQTACDLCAARFETPHALSAHMNAHYPQFVCGACGLEVATKSRLRAHARTHDEGPFACKICDKEFSNSNTRNAHTWRVHSKTDPFKCRHCALRFPTFLQRLRHVQSAHEETPQYPCQFCGTNFSYAAIRTKHIRTVHLNERPHKCPECPAAFARARNLAAHRASKHGAGAKPHRCPTCGVCFYFRSALRWHAAQHAHKFECNQCDQKFATSPELDSHIQIHEHADNMAINLDFVTSLQLDSLADDYTLLDPSYLDLNEL